MSNYTDYAKMDAHQLAAHIQQVLTSPEAQASFTPKTQFTQNNKAFGGGATVTISVPYVNNRHSGVSEAYQNTSQKLHSLLAPLMNEMRAQGLVFSQPMGVVGKGWDDARYQGGELEFTVGPNPTPVVNRAVEFDTLDDLLGEGAGNMGVVVVQKAQPAVSPVVDPEVEAGLSI